MFRPWQVVLVFVLFAGVLFAAEGDVYTFELKWQENGESRGFSEQFNRDTPFDKEPELAGTDVFRGELKFRGQSSESDSVGFIWDKSGGKLYVDLNKDGDLTNDPNGIIEKEGGRISDYQDFSAFPVSFSTPSGVYRYQVSAFMQGYDFFQQATFTIRSGYAGKVDLYGRRWRFEVNDALKGGVDSGSMMSVRPIEEGTQNFLSSLGLTKSLFLDGRCYDVAFEFKDSGDAYPTLWCTLTERNVPLAMLRVEGKWVQQLVLGNEEMLVLASFGEASVPVPAMSLAVKQCYLKYDEDEPVISPQSNLPSVGLLENQETVLKIGGPLCNSVDVGRSGRVLNFSYTLIGAGGEKYDARQISNYDYSKKPSVAIYKGDLLVGSGEFEYG